MKSLNEIYQKYQMEDCGGDKGTAHSYLPIYEKRFRNKRSNISLLEIGVYHGHSLKMWEEYFDNSEIIGIDTNLKQMKFPIGELKLHECDATDSSKLQKLFNNKKFDYIIDDGSHLVQHQLKSFQILFPFLKEGGVYFIEDVDNLDHSKHLFEELHPNIQIMDLRPEKNRYDDVLIIIEK